MFWSVTQIIQLKSLMEREALEGGRSDAASPGKAQQEELFLFPAESSSLTTLPGVARVVHSKASCTVHWLESGKSRPNAKELPAAQILGIHTAPPPRTGSKAARGAGAGAGAGSVLGDTRRTEPLNLDAASDTSAKVEEKKLQPPPVPVSSQQTVATREDADGIGSSEAGRSCGGVEAGGGGVAVNSGAETSSEPCKEDPSTSSPEANQTPPAKAAAPGPEDGVSQGPAPAAKERSVEQIREEGWSCRDAENVTLAELYLMFGKPGKLQLEYEWLPTAAPSGSPENGQTPVQPKPTRTNRVLRCLLKLVSTEVNPKPLVRTFFYLREA